MTVCPYDISVAEDGVTYVSGAIDETVTDHFGEELLGLLREGDVVLDLSSVQFLPSSALTWLVRALRVSESGKLILRTRPQTIAHRVLSITKLPFVETPAR